MWSDQGAKLGRRAAGGIPLLFAWLVAAVPAHADSPALDGPDLLPAPRSPAEERLRVELQGILRSPELKHAFAGVHVRLLGDGRTLYSHNAGKLFNPASNMKLLTTAAALWHLGPSYRFKTVAVRDDAMAGGVVQGNLYVRGHGDPMLTTEELFGFVNEIALHGIQKVTGDLIIDDTFFDAKTEGPGWEQEIGDHAYAAPVGPLSANFGTFTARVRPGSRIGELAEIVTFPEVPSIEIVVGVQTRGPQTRTRLWVGTTRQPDDGVRVTVRGSIAADDYEGVVIRRRVNDPSRYTGEMLYRMLEMRGVRFGGKVKKGTLPRQGAVHVATRWSEPLADVISTLNKYSNNVMAEQILKTLGAELYEPPGTWESGSRAVRDFLKEIGIPGDTYVLANGSGLNDVNRVTPVLITHLLDAMYRRFEVGPEFVASLAVAGSSGTITGRFTDSPAASRLRAKTGSLTGVSALSGYVITRSNDVLAFSVMMNDYSGRARAMWRIQDRIGIALARFQSTDAIASGEADTPPAN